MTKKKLSQVAVYLTDTSLVMLLLPGFPILMYVLFQITCFLLDVNSKSLVERNLITTLILTFVTFLVSGSLVGVVVWVADRQPLRNCPTCTLESRKKNLERLLTSVEIKANIWKMELVSVNNELSARKQKEELSHAEPEAPFR